MTNADDLLVLRLLSHLEMGTGEFTKGDLAQARVLFETVIKVANDPMTCDPRDIVCALRQIDNGFGCWLEWIDVAIATEKDNKTGLIAAYGMAKVLLFSQTKELQEATAAR